LSTVYLGTSDFAAAILDVWGRPSAQRNPGQNHHLERHLHCHTGAAVPLLAALFLALLVPGIVSAQTALWLSVTGPQSGSTYYVGDSFSLTITGAPYAAVTVATPGSTPYLYGYTDWSGTWAVNGYWPAQYAGCYTQTWAVAGVAAPTLSFCVQPLPSPTLSLSVNGEGQGWAWQGPVGSSRPGVPGPVRPG